MCTEYANQVSKLALQILARLSSGGSEIAISLGGGEREVYWRV